MVVKILQCREPSVTSGVCHVRLPSPNVLRMLKSKVFSRQSIADGSRMLLATCVTGAGASARDHAVPVSLHSLCTPLPACHLHSARCRYEQLEAERLERLVQAFQDRMIDVRFRREGFTRRVDGVAFVPDAYSQSQAFVHVNDACALALATTAVKRVRLLAIYRRIDRCLGSSLAPVSVVVGAAVPKC